MAQASETLERVFREEYGRIIATLIRLSGSSRLELPENSITSICFMQRAPIY